MFGTHWAQLLFQLSGIWEPILLAARTELDSSVQESSSEDVVGLPQRCAKASTLFDDLLRILWTQLQCIADVPNYDGGLANVFERQ